MDSNGRHRNASGSVSASVSNLTLPSSSTLRRLPNLARSPFRRSEKTSSPPPVDPSQNTNQGHSLDPVAHHRGSTFPSLSQVVVDDSSVSSAFFASTSGSTASDLPSASTTSPSRPALLPPSRSSSLLPTPEINVSNDGHQPPLSPFPNKPGSSPQPMTNSQGQAQYSNPLDLPQPPSLTGGHDLEPITYPSHLAQMKPDLSSSSSSASASRVIPRRDFSGPPILGAVHQAGGSSGGTSSGSGGPPFGVPRRKESILATEPSSSPFINGSDSPNHPAEGRLREGETDSGTDETVVTRRRANTRTGPSASRGTRERSVTVTGSAPASGSESGPGNGQSNGNITRERTRKVSNKVPKSSSSRTLEPSLPNSRSVPRAPASAMYFSPVPCHGRPPNQALRAHSGTLVGERIWVIGGVDKHSCWRGVAWFDTESLLWSTIETRGEQFPPLRAHTTTLVGDKLFIFGGGDGPSYSNEVWHLDTTTHRFSRPVFGNPKMPLPPPRRAHTTVSYKNYLVIFGGGNGQAALNDVWALDVSDVDNLSWHEWKTRGDVPQKKGYHTANLVGDKMIVFGGSDGHASFADIHILNLQTRVWTLVATDVKHNRLSHTSTQVGSYLFILGGHNGQTYAQDVLLFNLVTLQWETKLPRGVAPPGRGYHVALLHDARIFISGGYNGESVFDDLWTLDLSAGAYLPQVTTFEVDEVAEHRRTD